MPIPTPNLDDRDFRRLMDEAHARIRVGAPAWTDQGPSDPGTVLLETFAYLTEALIYRMNRVPEKAFRAYLNLIGIELLSPSAASVELLFSRDEGVEPSTSITIPRGSRIALEPTGGAEDIEFVLTGAVELNSEEDSVTAIAHNCELVEAELLGTTSSDPIQVFQLTQAPATRTSEEIDVFVAVAAKEGELSDRTPALEVDGQAFRIIPEVPNLAEAPADTLVFVLDRQIGQLRFGDGTDGSRPPVGRQVRAWYRTGGGEDGNVTPGTLTRLVDPIPGLLVTNPGHAVGGSAGESIEDAVVRGPKEFHHRERAVTERDYENLATRLGAVSRARAYARSELWSFASPGSVEVVLVPHIEQSARVDGRVTLADLHARSTPSALNEVERFLAARRPLGVETAVRWTHHKSVSVNARVGVRREEDADALKQRVTARLHRTINPLSAGRRVRASQGSDWPGWPFGQSLRVSDVYDILLAEPGVAWADQVRLVVSRVPNDNVRCLSSDNYQAGTWYAASGADFFRSLNNASGWELARTFDAETVTEIEPYPREPGRVGLGERAGYLAVVTRIDGEKASKLYVSYDMGETWSTQPVAQFSFLVEDLAWVQRNGEPALLIATRQGLYEQSLRSESTPQLLTVDPARNEMGFAQVVAYTQSSGRLGVAVASENAKGVYRSREDGRSGTFRSESLLGEDVRSLEIQYEATATFLWAGTAAEGGDTGNGCFRARLEENVLNWDPFEDGWEGGTCWALGFADGKVFGASHKAGVQWLDPWGRDQRWTRPTVDCGLAMQEVGRFHPVNAMAVDAIRGTLLTGGPNGVSLSGPGGLASRYTDASRSKFDDTVTIPSTWLFVSGDHNVEVVIGDATGSN